MSKANDPIFKTIHFQYYTLVVLIQIKYFWNSVEASSSEEEEEEEEEEGRR